MWCQMQSGTWKRYSAPDAVQGLLQQVKRDLSIDAATEFTHVSTRSGDRRDSRPFPSNPCTACIQAFMWSEASPILDLCLL